MDIVMIKSFQVKKLQEMQHTFISPLTLSSLKVSRCDCFFT